MYSLTPKITTREYSSGNTTPRMDMSSPPTAFEYDNMPAGGSMATAMTRRKYSNNRLGKFFSMTKSSKAGNYQDVELHNSSCPELQAASPPMKDAKINPAIRPEGQKLVARMEPRLPPRGAKKLFNPPAAPLIRPSQTLVRATTEPVRVDHGEANNIKDHHMERRNRNVSGQTDGSSHSRADEPRNCESVKSSSSTSRYGTILRIRHSRRLLFTPENQIGTIAKEWAVGNEEAYSWWCWYLESYAKGQFNLTKVPPIRYSLSSENYFPALFPTWEQDMLSEAQRLEVIWSQWTAERRLPTEEILMSAVGRFKTSFMALSFFNENYEIIKVENGYNAKYIPRDASLAAHALLSKEVFTVLDTKKAFQFKDHPLVLNEPKIRFFAAAPLLSSNDVPIAVFSVWSQEPRTSFTQADKLDLATYASVMLGDLQDLADTLSTSGGRSTPLLQRDSTINGDYRRSMAPSPFSAELERLSSELVKPLQFHRDQALHAQSSGNFSATQAKKGLLCEQTPPSSAEADQGPTFSNLQEGFGKNFKQLSVNLDVSTYPHLQDMITPESTNFDISRPFSGSDLTSVHREPNNTPHNTPVGEEVTDFLALSDRDIFEDVENSASINRSGWTEEVDASQVLDESVELSETESFSADLIFSESPDLSLTARNLATILSSPLIDLSTPPQDVKVSPQPRASPDLDQPTTTPPSPLLSYSDRSNWVDQTFSSRESGPLTCAEASSQLHDMVAEQLPGLSFTESTVSSQRSAYALDTWTSDVDSTLAQYAREFGYDKMYAVEMIPAKLDITKKELYEPGGINYNVLASCGPTELDPRSLNHAFHVDCLRSRDYKFYSCKESNLTGIVFPYPKDSISPEQRTRGMLFGAFKNGMWPMDPDAELTKLWKIMDSLMELILKPSRTLVSRRSKSDQVSPKPFPASEAREVGGHTQGYHHSLDFGLDFGLDQAMNSLHMQDLRSSAQEKNFGQEVNWSEDHNGEDHIEDYTLAVNYFGQAYIKKRGDCHSRTGSDESRNSGKQSHRRNNHHLRPSQLIDARETIALAR